MKKTIKFFTILAAITFLFAACQKDGVFKPSKKISKMYEQVNGGEKRLVATATWDKNLLQKVELGDNYFQRFEYKGNQVIKVSTSDGIVYDFTYNGNKIDKITYTENNTLSATVTFTHDGSKIVKSETVFTFADKKAVKAMALITKLVLPDCKTATYTDKELAYKGTQTETHEFTWEKNNIVKDVTTVTYGTTVRSTTTEFEFNKDGLNPQRGLFGDMDFNHNKNTISSIVETDYDGSVSETAYEYEYDGKYPVKALTYNEEGKLITTTFYEYVK